LSSLKRLPSFLVTLHFDSSSTTIKIDDIKIRFLLFLRLQVTGVLEPIVPMTKRRKQKKNFVYVFKE